MALLILNHNRINRIPQVPKGKCRGCLGQVPKGRRTWCSDQCVTDALVKRGDIRVIRRELKKRDRQICQKCGMNTKFVRRILKALERASHNYRHSKSDRATYNEALGFLFRHLFGGDASKTGFHQSVPHLWEADHILPVCEGGGNKGLENYRTLCRRCHKEETRLLAQRRAAAKKLKTCNPLLTNHLPSATIV